MIKALNKHVVWGAVKARITFSSICRNNDKQISRWESRDMKKPKIFPPHKRNVCIKKTGQTSKDKELPQKELIRFWSNQYWRGLKLIASEWVKTGRYISVGIDGSAALIYSWGSEWNFWLVSHRGSSHVALNWTVYIQTLWHAKMWCSQSQRNQPLSSNPLFYFQIWNTFTLCCNVQNTTKHLNSFNWITWIWGVCSEDVSYALGNVCIHPCPDLLISPLNLHLISGFGTNRQLNISERRLYIYNHDVS